MQLRLSGLVVEQQGKLRVYNRIYASVFDKSWVDRALADLRPYSEAISAWLASECQDVLCLLRKEALRDALVWASDKSLSDQDYQFLAASQELEKRDVQIALEAERKALQAQKQANQILAEAQQKAQRTIKRGLAGLAAISIVAAMVVVWAGAAVNEAQQKVKAANTATNQANQNLAAAKTDLENVEQESKQKSAFLEEEQQKTLAATQQRQSAEAQLKAAQQQTQLAIQKRQSAEEKLQAAQQQTLLAIQKKQSAEERLQAAQQHTQQANRNLAAAKGELAKVRQEAEQNIKAATEEVNSAGQKVKAAEEKVLAAEKKFQEAQQKTQQANQELTAAKSELERVNQEEKQKTAELEQVKTDLSQTQNQLNQSENALSESIGDTLTLINRQTKQKPAILYISFVASTSSPHLASDRKEQDSDELGLLLVTTNGQVRKRPGATRSQVRQAAVKFRAEVTSPRKLGGYLAPARELYQWLIAPLEADLQAQGISNIVFIMDGGLRSIPLAALHDGQRFLIEKYSIAVMPSLSLTDPRHVDLKNARVLAMGVSQSRQGMSPLPSVPVELSNITKLWPGKSFLDEAFTLDNLKSQHRRQPFQIMHLATNAEFQPGVPANSYIQLWDTKLRLDQLEQLGWNESPVELLVLSACRTAFGDKEAKFGFAGLAVQAGVKSVLASLWYVSDEGTLALMTEFYGQLRTAPIKAEALRQTQLAMLRGEVGIEGGQLRSSFARYPLPPTLAQLGDKQQLSHPYYWAGFTMIGNPW